ncbi:hypothetical protein [Caulobacter sp. RL271]|uniref:Uncharacterized protein n=1 Tax=Caulobacter segnis TaxID=88688 RepID=A0ABY4ZX39_9CAUL|nr:hypothetical protein [Caulobacter segnis]USQ97265.1 hypothetical protein MZV50_06900 [Caulobacter segnis]
MTNGVRNVPSPALMTEEQEAFDRAVAVKVVELLDREAAGSSLGKYAGTVAAMGAMRAIGHAVWMSLPLDQRGEVPFRARMQALCGVTVDNVMIDKRGSRRQ